MTAWLNDLLGQARPRHPARQGDHRREAGENKRLVFQAVHMILEGDFQREWTDKDKALQPHGVIIGRDLDEAELREASRGDGGLMMFPSPCGRVAHA
ncbi:GTP-binding protein [Caulobacter segnis]